MSLAMVQEPITYKGTHAASMARVTRSCRDQPAFGAQCFHISSVAQGTTMVVAAGLTAMRARRSGRKQIGARSISCLSDSPGQPASKLCDVSTARDAAVISSAAVPAARDPSLKKFTSIIRIVLALCMMICLASAAISGNTGFAIQMLILWNCVRALLNLVSTNEQK